MIQTTAKSLYSMVSQLLSHKLGRNVGWLTMAEMVSRLGRIVAAVVLARQLDATAFGVAAIALTVFEIVRVFTENGIGAAVIRAKDSEFKRTANTAYRLMWLVCIILAVVQLLAGLLVETLIPDRQAGAMVAVLGLVFLIMPFGVVHGFCLYREERLKHLAIVASTQAMADHILTAVLALSGFGAWAIVLPKVLTAPIWLICIMWPKAWVRDTQAGYAPVRDIVQFSLPVLGAELLSTFRDQIDKLVVSVTLGVDALGIYYFAFNAGLGLSTALNKAFSNALYPHLSAAKDRVATYRKAIKQIGFPFCFAYAVQAAAALFYVPVVFGSNWASAAPLVALLCLGGPARLLIDSVRMKARADGRSGQELVIALGLSVSVLVPFALATPFGLFAAAIASVVGASLYSVAQIYSALSFPTPNLTTTQEEYCD